MPTVTFTTSDKTIHVSAGTTLLEACHRAGIGIPASCGGKGLCGKCRVRIVEGEVPSNPGYEQALSPAEVSAGWRLACLVEVNTDLVVEDGQGVPVRNEILTEFVGRDVTPDHSVRAVSLKLPEPSLDDQMCDLGRIARALDMDGYPECVLPLMQQLPLILRNNDFAVTAVLHDDELVALEPADGPAAVLGLAVDIGTTTLAGTLFDLTSGEALAVASQTNPQAMHGDDVVSRIDYSSGGPEQRAELQKLVVDAVNDILRDTCDAAGVSTNHVYLFAAGGNTTMHHLLLGLDAGSIAASPFIAGVRRGLSLHACDIGLNACLGARLYTMPNISAYVGGDIVGGILAHDLHHVDDETVVLIDAGTNGEMALRANGCTYACATAAGPAFEGARIRCGMRAATGAVSAVTMEDNDLRVITVDDAPARGICGTGLMDAVSVLLDAGLIDETGRMLKKSEALELDAPPPAAMVERLQEYEDQPAFLLAEAVDSQTPDVVLTQKDVREFQLAKGAISAGVRVMLDVISRDPAEVDRVLLAGAFGSRLKPASALRVGLIPDGIPEDRISFVGNAALSGTRLSLLNEELRQEAEILARETRYIELSGRLDFQMAFADGMEFPASSDSA